MSAPREPRVATRPAAVSGKDRYERFLQDDIRRSRAMDPRAAVTAAHVSGVILKDVDRRRGEDGAWRVEPQPIRARESWVFKAHTPLAPWPLAVKVYCDAVTDDEIATHSEHLRRCYQSMARCPELTVPAVWASVPEHRTLIMQWIEEPRLDQLMRCARGDRGARARLFTAAGGWLRQYHGQSNAVVRRLKTKSLGRHIDMLLGGEEGAGKHVRDAVFRNGYEVLVGHADAFAKWRVPYVMAHGDFVPHNLFHGSGCTIGFDMVPRPRPALNDICHFLVHAELKKPFMTRRTTLTPTGIERQDTQAFFDAYGPLNTPGSEALLAYMVLNEALLRWAVVISHLRRGGAMRLEHLPTWLRYRRMVRLSARAIGRVPGD